MKRLLVLAMLCILSATASAEKATFDLVRYTPPPPFKKIPWVKSTAVKNILSYSNTDQATRTYCQIFIVKSTISKGDIDADFESEWKDLIIGNYKNTTPAQITDTAEEDGWKVKAGVTTFDWNNGTSIAMLTSISGYGRVVSIAAVTDNQAYASAIQALLGSVEMKKPATATATTSAATASAKRAAKGTAKPAALQGYMEYNPFTKAWTWKVRYPPQ